MAAEEFGDKTHEATPYRRQKAREEGQVVRRPGPGFRRPLIAGLCVCGTSAAAWPTLSVA